MVIDAPKRAGSRGWLWLLIGLLIGGAAGAGTMALLKRGKTIPTPRLSVAEELALVPADAVGFIHVRLRDIWKTEPLADIRALIEKAGPDALAVLDSQFAPAPSTLDRATVVFLAGDPQNPRRGFQPGGGAPLFPGLDLPVNTPDLGGAVVILSFTEPFDTTKFRASAMPAAAKGMSAAGKEIWIDAKQDLCAYFPMPTVMVLGSIDSMERFVTMQPRDGKHADGPLGDALRLATEGKRHLVAALNTKLFGPIDTRMFDRAPPDVKAIQSDIMNVLKARAVAVGLVVGKDTMRLEVRASYGSDDEAASAEKSIGPIAHWGRGKLDEAREFLRDRLNGAPGRGRTRPVKELPEAVGAFAALGALNKLDEYLAKPPITREGTEVVATFDDQSISGSYISVAAVSVAMLVPAVQKVREAAARASASNNLKQIGLAMHMYHDTMGKFPPQNGVTAFNGDPNPKPLLSWRVHLLPYMEQQNLYDQFKLDEPWDSPNNKRLIAQMPKLYASPSAPTEPGKTYCKVFVGGGAMFSDLRQFNLVNITDGTSNTIMAIEGGAPVIWTKPDDIPYDPAKPLPDLKLLGNSRIQVLMADGSVRMIDLGRISEKTLRAAITAADGDVLGDDW
jgi:hypothetical protein